MKTIALIIMVSIVLEALVEYIKTVMHMVEEKEYKTAITQAITIVLGVFLAFSFNLQLFNGAMVEFYENLHINPALDMILTGILFSRGSNYFSDLIGKLTKKDTSLGEIIAVREDGLGFENEADYEDEEDEFWSEEDKEGGEADGIADTGEA